MLNPANKRLTLKIPSCFGGCWRNFVIHVFARCIPHDRSWKWCGTPQNKHAVPSSVPAGYCRRWAEIRAVGEQDAAFSPEAQLPTDAEQVGCWFCFTVWLGLWEDGCTLLLLPFSGFTWKFKVNSVHMLSLTISESSVNQISIK